MNKSTAGLYVFKGSNGHLYYAWYSAVLSKRGVGWHNRIVALSDKRHLLGKYDPLPEDAILSAPKVSNHPQYQRYQNLVWAMENKHRTDMMTEPKLIAQLLTL